MGTLVCDPRRPEMVRADRGRGSARERADGDRSAVPDGQHGAARGAPRGQASARDPGTEGAHRDPFEHEQKAATAAASDGRNGHEVETQVAPRPTSELRVGADGHRDATRCRSRRRRRQLVRRPEGRGGSAARRRSVRRALGPEGRPSCWRATVRTRCRWRRRCRVGGGSSEQYRSYMQIILVAAAIVSLAIKEWSTGVLLILITVLNAVVGLRQEGKARERDERAQGDGQGNRAGSPRRVRGRDPGRGGRRRRRRAAGGRRRRAGGRADHRGELAADR